MITLSVLEGNHIIIPTIFPPYREIPGHYLGCGRGAAFAANHRTYSCLRHSEVSLNFLLYSLMNLTRAYFIFFFAATNGYLWMFL